MPFKPGNKLARGGKRVNSGYKPAGIRELCGLEFEKRIPILCEIADEKKNRPEARILAVKELARVGIGDKIEHTGVNDGPIQVENPLTAVLADQGAAELLNDLIRRMAMQPGGNGEQADRGPVEVARSLEPAE